MKKQSNEFVQLARLALTGKPDDVLLFVRRHAHRVRETDPETSVALQRLAGAGSPTRALIPEALPVDSDSRLELLRRETAVHLDIVPTWPESVRSGLEATIAERKQEVRLNEQGLTPTRSLLFAGPPGVGKTLAARYLAAATGRPLLTLDLSAVMSSFLGRTGNNLRVVLDYAQRAPSVLLLDEFDAIAKRRDDSGEIGELKRLVTVLLQTIDQWPSSGILVAATNHPDLLDPAVWRRFERVIEFPMPDLVTIERAMIQFLGSDADAVQHVLRPLAVLLQGSSFSVVERELRAARRRAIVESIPIDVAITTLIQDFVQRRPRAERIAAARELQNSGLSQRQISDLTGVSRDTLRKHSTGTSAES